MRKRDRRNAAHIQALEAMQAKKDAVLARKIADANAARKKLRELQCALQVGDEGVEAGGGGGCRMAGERVAVADAGLCVYFRPVCTHAQPCTLLYSVGFD